MNTPGAPASIGMQLLRWLATPIAAVALMLGCAIAARAVVAAADSRCAQQDMVGGTCIAPWHTDLVETTIYVAIIVAALTVAVIPALIAPRFRRGISIIGWLLTSGTVAAAFIATGWQDLRLPLAATVIAGALGVLYIWNKAGHSHHANG
ncbi:MAG: hypothetical protein AB8B93_05235 [Pseudomonadales bacterium]